MIKDTRYTDSLRTFTRCAALVLAAAVGNLHAQTPAMAVNVPPHLVAPAAWAHASERCFQAGKPYADTIGLADSDFVHGLPPYEVVRLTLIAPPGFNALPAFINGPLSTPRIDVMVSAQQLPHTPGPISLMLIATDSRDGADTLRWTICISEPLLFEFPVTVSAVDSLSGVTYSETLVLGIGQRATSGTEPGKRGHLDSDYCERELAPPPADSVFDVRWLLPERNGVRRSIGPGLPAFDDSLGFKWFARVNPGATEGRRRHPWTIRWTKSDAAKCPIGLIMLTDPSYNSAVGTFRFVVNMREPNRLQGAISVRDVGPDTVEAIVDREDFDGFIVYLTGTTGVDPAPATHARAALACAPNPVTSGADIAFALAVRTNVRVTIADAAGHDVRTLLDASADAGMHHITWNGADDNGTPLPAGTYFCRLATSSTNVVRAVQVR